MECNVNLTHSKHRTALSVSAVYGGIGQDNQREAGPQRCPVPSPIRNATFKRKSWVFTCLTCLES